MSKLHTIMLNGYCVPRDRFGIDEHSLLTGYYRNKDGYHVFGDGEKGFKLEDVNNFDERVRVDISAHGRIKNDLNGIDGSEVPIYTLRSQKKLEHQLQILPDIWQDTSKVIESIVKGNSATKFFEFHIWSCYGGSSVSNFTEEELSSAVSVLPRGSILFAHGPVIIDAWSVNLYNAQLASLCKRDHTKNTIILNVPMDIIECLSVGLVDSDGHKHQFNMRTIPISSDVSLVKNYLEKWVDEVKVNYSTISKAIGVNLEFELEFSNDAVLEQFMKSMLVTAIRSSPKEFLVTISKFERCYSTKNLLTDEHWKDILDDDDDDEIKTVLSNLKKTDTHGEFKAENDQTIQTWHDGGTTLLMPGDRECLLEALLDYEKPNNDEDRDLLALYIYDLKNDMGNSE